ncbi:MAG: phosphotransferase [Candidatus Taylorbacteria bacterium]|nr:phosphotransferase [Candidatus Taylorbacteria bacterium]
MKDILEKINNLYGINVSSYEKVKGGFLSENYFLFAGANRFFLKKYRFDNQNRIAEVHASKKYFADGGIPVILPIPLLNRETFFEYDSAYYALFPFAEGKHMEKGELTEKAIISLGQTLGRIHILGKESKLAVEDYFKIEKDENVFKKIDDILIKISEVRNPSDFDKVALQSVKMKKELLLKNKMTFESLDLKCDHLIHGDYLDHNVFFDEGDNVKWVFDFEKTNYSPRTYELFRSMIYIFLSGDITKVALDNAKKYLDAYSSVYPISKDEIKRGFELYYIKTIHGFWVESEHYLKGNTRVDHFLFENYKRIKYLSENLNRLIDVL